ncbi:hypothetical protein [Microbacterium algeriense]
MAEQLMVVIDGVRYRKEDAERLGKTSKAEKPAAKAKTPANKAATPNDK